MDSTTIDKGRAEIAYVLEDIIEKKEQKTHGIKRSSFLIDCHVCKRKCRKAFMGYNIKKKKFMCFDCLQEELAS